VTQRRRALGEFAAPGAVTIAGNGQTVSIHFDSRYEHEWSELERRLAAGERVLTTPANGNCGLLAVYMGFYSLSLTNGWVLPAIQTILQDMRNFLYPGPPNPAYWRFVYEAHSLQPTFLESDYTSNTGFGSIQLDLLTEWLAHHYANGTQVRNVYVCQEPGLSATHRLVLGHLEQRVNEQLIFIHYTRPDLNSGNHQYQGIGPAVFPNQFPVVGPPVPSAPVTGLGLQKPQYRQLPSGDNLLYITGRLHINPQTLAVGQVQIPVRNQDLQARFEIFEVSTISHRVGVARKATTFQAQLMPTRSNARPQITQLSRDLSMRWPDMIGRGVFFEPIVRPVPALPVPALPVPALPVPALPVPALPVPALPVPALPVPALPVPLPPAPMHPSQPLQQPQIDSALVDPRLLPMLNVVQQNLPAPRPQPGTPPGYRRDRTRSTSPSLPDEPQQAVQREYPSPPMRQEHPVSTIEEINVGTIEEVNNSPPPHNSPRPGRRRGHIRNAIGNEHGKTWNFGNPCFDQPDSAKSSKRKASPNSGADAPKNVAARNSKRQKLTIDTGSSVPVAIAQNDQGSAPATTESRQVPVPPTTESQQVPAPATTASQQVAEPATAEAQDVPTPAVVLPQTEQAHSTINVSEASEGQGVEPTNAQSLDHVQNPEGQGEIDEDGTEVPASISNS